HAVSVGRDPRTVTEELVRHLRNAFLSLMAPDLVVLPRDQVDALAALAQQIGAAGLVRAIEQLGSTLVDLRNAPDPRVLVEVVLVQLTHAAGGGDIGALEARIERLEAKLRELAAAPPAAAAAGASGVGGAAARRERPPATAPVVAPAVADPPPAPNEPESAAAPAASTPAGLSVEAAWEQAKGSLKGLARPLFAATTLLG